MSTINILLLACIPFFCYAQKKEKADTVKHTLKDFIPTGIRVGTDAIALIKTFSDDSYTGWELNTDIDFYRYYLAVDIGSWSRDFHADADSYSNKGTYFRSGIDVNFLKNDPDKNLLFFGARYAHAVFSESMDIQIDDPVWGGTVNRQYVSDNITAHWLELTGGLRIKVWKILWMGYTARYKFGLGTSKTPDTLPSNVPGYGNTDKKATWGFNYQILVRFPLRRDKNGKR